MKQIMKNKLTSPKYTIVNIDHMRPTTKINHHYSGYFMCKSGIIRKKLICTSKMHCDWKRFCEKYYIVGMNKHGKKKERRKNLMGLEGSVFSEKWKMSFVLFQSAREYYFYYFMWVVWYLIFAYSGSYCFLCVILNFEVRISNKNWK